MLAPRIPGEGGTVRDALNALEAIGNDESVPVLVEAFRKDFDYVALPMHTGQQEVLGALRLIPSERSLDAILDCAVAAERQLQKLDAKIAAMPDRLDRLNASLDRWRPLVEASWVGNPGGEPSWVQKWNAVLATYRPKDNDPLKAWVLAHVRTVPQG